jgi:ABC-type Fe3+-hydroxamate transport system substrate-binding protein
VGGTKKLDIVKIEALRPDLVIANKEENTREDIEQIRAFCPVWTSDISTVDEALDMISKVSELVGREARGQQIIQEIRNSFDDMPKLDKKAAYFIWKNPYMVAGGATYISSLMEASGLSNVFCDLDRYPEVSLAQILAAKPELLLLSSEPYPFKLKDLEALHQVLPRVKIILVDGEIFSWYGSRMKFFHDYITEKLV